MRGAGLCEGSWTTRASSEPGQQLSAQAQRTQALWAGLCGRDLREGRGLGLAVLPALQHAGFLRVQTAAQSADSLRKTQALWAGLERGVACPTPQGLPVLGEDGGDLARRYRDRPPRKLCAQNPEPASRSGPCGASCPAPCAQAPWGEWTTCGRGCVSGAGLCGREGPMGGPNKPEGTV